MTTNMGLFVFICVSVPHGLIRFETVLFPFIVGRLVGFVVSPNVEFSA